MKKFFLFLSAITMFTVVFSGCSKNSSEDSPASDKCGSMVYRSTVRPYGDLFTDTITAGLPYNPVYYQYNPDTHITTINFQSTMFADICCWTDSLFTAHCQMYHNDSTIHLNFFKIYVDGIWHKIFINKSDVIMYFQCDTTFATRPLNNDGPAAVDYLWSLSFPSQTTRKADFIYLANRLNWSIYMKYPRYIGK